MNKIKCTVLVLGIVTYIVIIITYIELNDYNYKPKAYLW